LFELEEFTELDKRLWMWHCNISF